MSNAFTALLLECFVRSSLAAIAVAAILFVLRLRDPRVRHRVWAALALWMLLLPLWTAWGPRAAVHLPAVPSTSPLLETHSMRATAPVALTTSPAAVDAASILRWPNLLLAVYLIVAAAFLARLIAGTFTVRKLRKSAVLLNGHWTSSAWSVPVTIGFVHPRIVLPVGWAAWHSSQLDAVLLHEQEHADRRDALVQWVALLNRAVFWFHPLAWLLESRIASIAEEGCDAVVLARGHDPAQYAGYLLEMARLMQRQGARLPGSPAFIRGADLQSRIRRILGGAPTTSHPSRARTACVSAASAVLTTIGAAAAVEPVGQVKLATLALPKPAVPTPVVALSTAVPLHRRLVDRHMPVLLARAQASAASQSGSISGTVEDGAGARIPDATITVRDAAGAPIASVHSGPAGVYQIGALAPGAYTVEFVGRGFAARTVDARVAEGKSTRIHAALELGQIYETVEVTAARPRAAVSSTLSSMPPKAPIAVGGLVRAARLVKQTQPVYPAELREKGIEGTVILRALISNEGVPVNVHVLNDDEVDPRLAEAARQAVETWRYEPTRLDEQPVEGRVTIEILFRLDK
jgi:TonB family protein